MYHMKVAPVPSLRRPTLAEIDIPILMGMMDAAGTLKTIIRVIETISFMLNAEQRPSAQHRSSTVPRSR